MQRVTAESSCMSGAAESNRDGARARAGLGSVTVHVQDIDRDRGYTTTASRRKRRAVKENPT